MFKTQKLKIILVACVFSLIVAPVFAAEIFFDVKTKEVRIGEQFEIGVFMNTENELINAVEGAIVFPADQLLFVETRSGNSIINFWVEQPALKTREKVVFSGIVPGGYDGSRGLLLSFVFKAKKEGRGAIELRDVRALKNDGLGTSAEVKISNLQFAITHETTKTGTLIDTKTDKEPPEQFTPQIASDPFVFEGKWFLVFATQDKGSGIDRHEVREGWFDKFVIARSPYLLRNQALDKKIFVKAIDKAGNERIIKIAPRNPLAWYENYENWIIIIGVFAIYLGSRLLWKKRRKI